MARVQLVIPDADKAQFVYQARREGMSLSAWLRAAAGDRLEKRQELGKLKSTDEMRAFWERCDENAGPGREPDWEEHLNVINESRARGFTNT